MKHHTSRRHGPSLSIVILVLAVVSVGFGSLFNLICTLVERQMYPRNYTAYVEEYAKQYDVPPNILYAIIKTESGFDASAVSEDDAVGLMQLVPNTFRWLSDDVLHEYLDDGMRYDPETNVRYGTYYLSFLYDRYGDWELALAAYNGGLVADVAGHAHGLLVAVAISNCLFHSIGQSFIESFAYEAVKPLGAEVQHGFANGKEGAKLEKACIEDLESCGKLFNDFVAEFAPGGFLIAIGVHENFNVADGGYEAYLAQERVIVAQVFKNAVHYGTGKS